MDRQTGAQENLSKVKEGGRPWVSAGHEKQGGPKFDNRSGQITKAALGTESEERTGWGPVSCWELISMQSSSPVKSLLP